MRWSNSSPHSGLSTAAWMMSLVLLVLPTVILGVLAYRCQSAPVAAGAGVQLLFVLVFLRAHPVWRPPVSISIVVLYLIALVWAWVPLRGAADWVPHLGQGVLLIVGVALLAVHDLTRTGAEPLRRARRWTKRILGRTNWPLQLNECRVVPEVAGLREAIREEASPALALLADPRPEVQSAALGALEYRTHWRAGEAELVLQTARNSREPAVRIAAIYALAAVENPDLVAELTSFLRDPAVEVRLAAAEALMWDAENRWPFARDGVRDALADPRFSNDGPLFAGVGRLPAAAVADLITWSAEHPPLASRAIRTLSEHYHAELLTTDRPDLANELSGMMLDAETPPALRVELAALLRDHNLLTADLLDRLTNLDQPAPIRLFAAELMLRINPHDPDGIDVLRGLARQTNRELALQVAAILQQLLGLELGLPPGELPASNTKVAAEVARRVALWANGANPDVVGQTPGPRLGIRTGFPAPAGPTPPPRPAYYPGATDAIETSDLLAPDEIPEPRPPSQPRSSGSSDVS
jgi:hypothetical protein